MGNCLRTFSPFFALIFKALFFLCICTLLAQRIIWKIISGKVYDTMKFHHKEKFEHSVELNYINPVCFTSEIFQEQKSLFACLLACFWKAMLILYCYICHSALKLKYLLIRKATTYKWSYLLHSLHQMYEKRLIF